MEWADGWWTSPFLDRVLPWLTHLGSYIAVLLFILISWILIRKRKVLLCLLLLFGIQSGISQGIKYLVQRKRPFLFLEMASKILRGPGEIFDPSFPSGHAVYAFMMAVIMAYWFPRYRIIFFIIAGFIGWTRIYLGLHYPTDIIAGALIGYGMTKLFFRYCPLWARDR